MITEMESHGSQCIFMLYLSSVPCHCHSAKQLNTDRRDLKKIVTSIQSIIQSYHSRRID